ncbi:MAG: PAS domain S-box protein, partial [Planctomycetota bacterium]|nr:PAS domain S-box protein [Planctomycetota bacterium]
MPDEKPDIERELKFFQETTDGLRKSLDELLALKEHTAQMLTAPTEEDAVAVLFKAARLILGDLPMVFLGHKEESDEFVPVGSHPPESKIAETVLKSLDQNLIRWVMSEDKPTAVPLGEEGMLTVIPISVRKMPVGILCADTSTTTDAMSQHVFEALATVAASAAAAILNIKMVSRLNDQYAVLSSTKTYLANVLDSINNGIIAMDMERRVSQINRNAATMLDINPPERNDIRMEALLPPKFVDVAREMLDETFRDGFTMERMFSHITSLGLELPMAVSTSMLRDETGESKGIIIILRDMTASKELERLRRIDQMKSEFVSNVSHEL